MEEGIGKENSRPSKIAVDGRKPVSEEYTVTSIPLIVRIHLVDVDFQLAIGIAVHVEPVAVCGTGHHCHCAIRHMNRCIVSGT